MIESMSTDPITLFCLADFYAYFTLPTLLPGFTLYLFAVKQLGDRIAIAASLVLTLLWGLWPVLLEPAAGVDRLLAYWVFPLARLFDSTAWKPGAIIFTLLTVMSVVGTACLAAMCIRRRCGKRLLATYLILSVYWSLCFAIFSMDA